MMQIKDKPEHDPVSDLYTVDAYLYWALTAAEEVVGKNGLIVVLRQAGLEHLINNYPPNQLKVSSNLTFGDYAALSSGLLDFFGRAGKSMTLRIGRQSARYMVEQQGALFGTAAIMAAKVLPLGTQLKMGLNAAQLGLRKLSQSVGQDLRLRVEDRGDKLLYIAEDCASCAGKQADERICWIQTGGLQEALRWQTGREFNIEEVECRALGAPACVWEVSKTPKAAES
jgi:predicted hydrocarbon binding protein